MRETSVAANGAMFAAAVLFGGSVVATRVAVQDVPPLSLAVLRYGIGGLVLGLCLLFGARGLLRVQWQDLPFLALLGTLLFAVFPLAFNFGLRLTEASRGSLMLATVPVWSAVLARVAGREELTGRQIIGLGLSLLGVAVAVAERNLRWNGDIHALAGDGLLLLAALCGATYAVLVKRAYTRYTALTVTAYGMVIGTLLLLPAALREGLPSAVTRLNGRTLALVLFLGVLGGALGWYLTAFALTRLTPTQAAVYINLNPLTAMILAAALLNEQITATLVVGFAVVVAGVVLMNWPTRVRAARADPIRIAVPHEL